MYEHAKYLAAGDSTITVELADAISPEVNSRVRSLNRAIERAAISGVRDIVPTYRSVLVNYDPLAVSPAALEERIRGLDAPADGEEATAPKVVELPTVYGGEFGQDIEFVAEHNGLTTDEVVRIHSGTDYLVYMMGFSPGFTYLGGLSERIATPRLPTPRISIPAGSVGIADRQTGVYPADSPGGWQIIGRTPIAMFDARNDPPVLVDAGDYVRFVPITAEEYRDIERRGSS